MNDDDDELIAHLRDTDRAERGGATPASPERLRSVFDELARRRAADHEPAEDLVFAARLRHLDATEREQATIDRSGIERVRAALAERPTWRLSRLDRRQAAGFADEAPTLRIDVDTPPGIQSACFETADGTLDITVVTDDPLVEYVAIGFVVTTAAGPGLWQSFATPVAVGERRELRYTLGASLGVERIHVGVRVASIDEITDDGAELAIPPSSYGSAVKAWRDFLDRSPAHPAAETVRALLTAHQ